MFQLLLMFLFDKLEQNATVDMNNVSFTQTFLAHQLLESAQVMPTQPDYRMAMKPAILRINNSLFLHIQLSIYIIDPNNTKYLSIALSNSL